MSQRDPLRGPDIRVLRYPSGRPWIVGSWPDGQVRTIQIGPTCLAVAGLCGAGDEQLRDTARRLGDVHQLSEQAARWPGSFHVIAAAGDDLLVRGTAYGVHRVYFTRIDGVVVASDRAAVLSRLTGAEVDVGALATRLLVGMPYPVGARPMWAGIHAVRPGEYLTITGGGRTSQRRRWHTPPQPEIPLAQGAPRVRESLATAVALRTAGGGLITSDMSGGLDSTSVSFLAARTLQPDQLIVCTGVDHPTDDDLRWARIAAKHLPGVEHAVFIGDELPLFYAGVLDHRDAFDRPCELVSSRYRATSNVTRMAPRGSRLHLTGIGGDHLFLGVAIHYHELIRTHPRLSLRQLRGYRTLFSWRWRDLCRALLNRRSFVRELADIELDDTWTPDISDVRMGWFGRPRTPVWLTDDCVDLIIEEISNTVTAGAEPLAPTRGRHLELEMIDQTTAEMLAWNDVAIRAGVPIGVPYFDDLVIDAALAVRVQDRTTAFAYKHLLARAMDGILPAESLRRRTKGEGSTAHDTGLRRHREELAALWTDSALGQLGLVNADMLRDTCATPNSPHLAELGIAPTLAAEVWLRTATPTLRATYQHLRSAG